MLSEERFYYVSLRFWSTSSPEGSVGASATVSKLDYLARIGTHGAQRTMMTHRASMHSATAIYRAHVLYVGEAYVSPLLNLACRHD